MGWKTILNFFGPDSAGLRDFEVRDSRLTIGARQVPLLLVRHRRARRYLLRLLPDGTARVTIPRNGTVKGAMAFAERNRNWLARQLALLPEKQPANLPWRAGSQIWFRGELVYVERLGDGRVRFSSEILKVPEGKVELRSVLQKHLRVLATRELAERVRHHAAVHGFIIKRVTVRNQKSRWGSCSSKGTVSLNWRLIQTPDFVSDYVILHELAHLRQMNHSAKFWQEVENLCPDFRRAKLWLRAHQRLLQ
jgi:predicted metal-dependent hydrolase